MPLMSDYVCLAFEFKCLQQFLYASPTTVSGGQKTCLFSTPIFQARSRLIKEPHSHRDLYSGKTWMGLEMVERALHEGWLNASSWNNLQTHSLTLWLRLRRHTVVSRWSTGGSSVSMCLSYIVFFSTAASG